MNFLDFFFVMNSISRFYPSIQNFHLCSSILILLVRFWLYEKEDGTIERIATQRHLDHPDPLDNEEMSYLAAVNEERKENLKNNNGVLQLNTFYQLMTIFVVCVMTVFTIQKITHGGRFPF